jgi:hypothetical protein
MAVKELIENLDGVERVLGADGKAAAGLDHPRAGDLVAVSRADAWFTYYYWLHDDRAPDFARTVDIHRKPGFDLVELFVDPSIRLPKVKIAWRLAQKALGQRTLMDVIPLDPSLVKGSHGRPTDLPEQGPCIISSRGDALPDGPVAAEKVKDIILGHLFSGAYGESFAAS